ncbi:multicopper oxidase domain-containing protein [Altererythrobacter gangjinensis]|uniref:Multicopper oxidase domain-containing protein n=2 Tax=Pontixanthobacter gangjinensis TaxID=1028742 RepID=A0A6I4SMY6_9SPHN|nr:multicopper oxidase domain-containing protein [Pontixanthobacter gangjinensis]
MVKGGDAGIYRLRALQYEQGHPGGARPERLLATISSSGPRQDDPIPGRLVNPPKMPNQPIARRRTITFKGEISGNHEMPMMHHEPATPRKMLGITANCDAAPAACAPKQPMTGMPPVKFTLDGKVFDLDRIDQHVVAGTVEEWTLVNLDVFQHPFHIHVNPFQIVAMNGQPVDDPTWWDVFPLPSKGSVTIRTYFRPDITGKTVYHCHILPHEDNGMMANVFIHPEGTELDAKGEPRT